MYEGLVRSWVPLKDKKTLGVIFDDTLIALKDFFVFNSTFFWEEAMLFQQYGYVRVGIYAGTAGDIDFWKKLVSTPQKQKALDDLLVQLGGEPITGKWYWSTSQYDVDKAFAWNFEENYQKPLSKHDRCSVRFVAELDYRFD